MTETHPLDLPFRGERTYLHGTDLHQAILAAVGERRPAGPVSITYHSLLRHQPDLVCSRDSLRELRDDPAFRGEIRFGAGTDVLHAAYSRATGRSGRASPATRPRSSPPPAWRRRTAAPACSRRKPAVRSRCSSS